MVRRPVSAIVRGHQRAATGLPLSCCSGYSHTACTSSTECVSAYLVHWWQRLRTMAALAYCAMFVLLLAAQHQQAAALPLLRRFLQASSAASEVRNVCRGSCSAQPLQLLAPEQLPGGHWRHWWPHRRWLCAEHECSTRTRLPCLCYDFCVCRTRRQALEGAGSLQAQPSPAPGLPAAVSALAGS